MSPRFLARLASASLAAATVGALWASGAWAHALATGTAPAADEILDTPPAEVVIEFNEPVTPVDAATGVVAPDGDRVDTGIEAGESPSVMVIAIDADQDGTYLVGYRVVSDDGHPVSGTFNFSVGTETAAPSADALVAETDPLVQGLLYANRGIGYAGLALALGGGVLMASGLGTASPRNGSASPRMITARLVGGGLSAVAVTAVTGIVLQAAYEVGASLSGLDGTSLQVVMESNTGLAGLLRLLLVLLALPLLRTLVVTERPGAPALAGLSATALALCATWPLAGHPMATEPVAVAFAADGIHLAAALTWIGGLAVLLVLASKRGLEIPEPARLAWMGLVPWLVGSAVVAGTASALLYVDSVAALTDTDYGRLIALKAGLLVVIVVVGLFTRKAIVRDGEDGKRVMRRLIAVEVALAAAVLAAVVVLVQAVPAKTALLEADAAEAASTELSVWANTDLYSAQLVLEPGRPGPNSVRILVSDLDGESFEAAEWEATWGLEGAEPESLRLIELRTGILGGEVSLPEAGRYVFTFTLTDAEGNSETAEATVDVS